MVKIKYKLNDIYAIKILDVTSEYAGKYLIMIKGRPETGEYKTQRGLFRFKISKTNELPTLEEVENLDYIKISWCHYLDKTPIPESNKLDSEFWRNARALKKDADEYGYLYTYLGQIVDYNKEIPMDITYIGNKKLPLPEDECIPEELGRPPLIWHFFWKNLTTIVNSYKDLNLRNSYIYEKEWNRKFKKRTIKKIKKHIYIRNKVQEDIKNGVDFGTSRGLTYVGGEDKDPYKSKKNKKN